jgi:hypothetical protein
MNLYVQYHNVANEGLLLSDPPFSRARLAIHTRRPNIRNADGRVFLVAGIGRPRCYFLWQTFQIEEVKSSGEVAVRRVFRGGLRRRRTRRIAEDAP